MLQKIGNLIKQKEKPSSRKERKLFSMKSRSTEFYTKGYTNIPNSIIHDPALSSQDLRVLITLNHHAMDKDACNPGIETIAFGARCGRASIVRSLKCLKKLNYIGWNRTKSSNNYILLYKVQKH